MIYNLYQVNTDGSKTLISEYVSFVLAQAAQTDDSVTYSIEQWDGYFATVLE